MSRKTLVALAAVQSFAFLFWGISPAHAVAEVPSFPACPAPGGTVVSQYSSGTHGIPGLYSTFTGSDAVYQINPSQLVQCFCPESGTSGIQSNWLKAEGYNQADIDYLRTQGWILIPDGSAWGLQPTAYLAKNIDINCGGQGGQGSTSTGPASPPICPDSKPPAPVLTSVRRSGTTAALTWTAVSPATHYLIFYGSAPGKFEYSVTNTGNVTSYTIGSLNANQQYYFEVHAVNGCMPGDAAAVGGGQVLGASTFAPTGNSFAVVLVTSLGLIFLGLSIIYGSRKHREI